MSWYSSYRPGLRCQGCGETFQPKEMGPRQPKYCSNACRQRAYRQSKAENDGGFTPARQGGVTSEVQRTHNTDKSVTSVVDTRNAPVTSVIDGRLYVRVRR